MLTDWVRISSAFTDIGDAGRGRLLFVVEDLRLSTVYEFRVRVRLLFHPVAPPPSGWSEFFESEMHRTLSEVSDLEPPVEAEVPDPPPPLFLTDGTGPACDPLPEPYHLQFWEALVPDSEWHDIQSGTTSRVDLSMGATCLWSFRTKSSRVFRKVSFSVSGVACQGQEKVFACLEASHHWLRTEGGVCVCSDQRR